MRPNMDSLFPKRSTEYKKHVDTQNRNKKSITKQLQKRAVDNLSV